MKKVIMLLCVLSMVLSMAVAENLQLFEAGKKAFSVGLYTIALENLDSYLSEDSFEKKSDALYLSGISSYYLKDYKNSITYLTGLIENFPDSNYTIPAFYWNGLNYYYIEEYNESIKWFDKSIESPSTYRDISLLYRALSYIQFNDIDKAKQSFLTLINDPSAKPRYIEEALYRLSTLYLEDEKYNDAINLLNKLIFDFSNSKYYEESLSLLSDTHFILKEWDSALFSYDLLKEFRPNDKEIYKRLATILYNLNELKKSKENLYYFYNNFGVDKDVLLMLGDILVVEGNLNEALSIYKVVEEELVIPLDETSDNNFRIGKIYYKLKKYSEAYNYFKKIESKESMYLAFLSGLRSNREILSINKKLNKNYWGDDYSYDANNRYINYLETNGNIKGLESFLDYLTQMYPNNVNYSLTYGELLLEDNRLEESLKYLTKGYNSNSPFYSNLSYKIGWIYYNKNEYARSIEYFDRVKKIDDDYIKSLYSKSIANYKLGNLTIGRDGFLTLLKDNTKYNEQISYYLGLIEKDNYNYKEALSYFNVSKNDKSLYKDSINNLAWCYYHLKQYENALIIYLETDNKFNAANCYLFMEEYEKALDLYTTVAQSDSELRSSSFYKSVEIQFKLEHDLEAFNLVKEFYKEFPSTGLPGEVIITHGDNLLYGGEIEKAIITYTKVMEIFPKGKEWIKARFRLAESFYLLEEYDKSISIYLESIKDVDIFANESIEKIVIILSELSDPKLTESVKLNLDRNVKDKENVIPIYIEYIKQSINKENILNEIENLISISRSRSEINQLIYLKALYYYTILDFSESENVLKVLLERPEVDELVKIDSIMLQGKIFSDNNKKVEAIDLYLNLYINFSSNRDSASNALYNGLILTKDLGDTQMENKIYNILKNEYSDTLWGRRGINEN